MRATICFAMQGRHLSPAAVKVGQCLDTMTRLGHESWLATKTIAAKIQYSVRAVQVALRELVDLGYIRIFKAPKAKIRTMRRIILLWRGDDPAPSFPPESAPDPAPESAPDPAPESAPDPAPESAPDPAPESAPRFVPPLTPYMVPEGKEDWSGENDDPTTPTIANPIAPTPAPVAAASPTPTPFLSQGSESGEAGRGDRPAIPEDLAGLDRAAREVLGDAPGTPVRARNLARQFRTAWVLLALAAVRDRAAREPVRNPYGLALAILRTWTAEGGPPALAPPPPPAVATAGPPLSASARRQAEVFADLASFDFTTLELPFRRPSTGGD